MLSPQEKHRIQQLKRKARKRPGPNPQIRKRIKGIRRGRNGIPTVNPDPKPPGTPVEQKTYTPGDITPPNTYKPQAPAYTPPPGSEGLSTYVPLPGQPDPRDERYWRDVVSLMEGRNQQQRELDMEGTNASVAYQTALGDLARQEPREQQSLKESANRAGAIYSSRTTEDLGKLQQEFFLERAGLSRQQSEEDAYRSLAREALNSGYRQDEVGALLEAIDRAAQAELDRPAPIPPKSEENTVGQDVKGVYGRNRIDNLRKRLDNAKTPEQRKRIRRKLNKAIKDYKKKNG